jgi:N-acyl amino acid synthase of PEP-CTERM/exosortase system
MNISLPVHQGEWLKKTGLYRKTNKIVKTFKRVYSSYQSLQEVKRISKYFASYFQPVVAQTELELRGAHKIRHDVFCKELELFDATSKDYEADDYDNYAKQCLIKHERTGTFSGTVRLIMPRTNDDILPIEKVAIDSITNKDYLPSNFNRDEVCEISRIAIPKDFRRRKVDKFDGAARAVINEETYSEIELRCFPLIAVGLYMTTAALAFKEGKKHAFFMVEPRLAKSMRYIGIKLIRIGEEFDYVGRRAPYYINNEDFLAHLSPSFKFMMKEFMKKI